MLMRSPIPSMGCGAWAANMNATAPRTTDVNSDAIEYHRSQPWNAAAAYPIAVTIKSSCTFVATMCPGTEASLLRSSGKKPPMMFHSP